MIKTDLLINHIDKIEQFAHIRYKFLSSIYRKNAKYEDTLENLRLHANYDILPICAVVFVNEMPAGICCIRKTDGVASIQEKADTGWLASFVIHEQFRKTKDNFNKKPSDYLIEYIFNLSKKLNFKQLYLHTFEENLILYYIKHGFEFIEKVQYSNDQMTNIMRLKIK
jgi:hypothetical protein